MIDDRTPSLNLPLPHLTNTLTEDVTRLRAALSGLDMAAAETVAALAAHAHGGTYQPLDGELTALAALVSAADRLAYFTGSGTAALTPLTPAARALLDDVDVPAMHATLNLGTAATTSAAQYATAAQGDSADAALQIALGPGAPMAASAVTMTYTDGVLTGISEDIGEDTRITTYTYAAGVLTQVVVTFRGVTRTETYTYTDGVLTGVTAVETA